MLPEPDADPVEPELPVPVDEPVLPVPVDPVEPELPVPVPVDPEPMDPEVVPLEPVLLPEPPVALFGSWVVEPDVPLLPVPVDEPDPLPPVPNPDEPEPMAPPELPLPEVCARAPVDTAPAAIIPTTTHFFSMLRDIGTPFRERYFKRVLTLCTGAAVATALRDHSAVKPSGGLRSRLCSAMGLHRLSFAACSPQPPP